MTKRFKRKLIEVEIRKGFLHIPSQGIELMPDENRKVILFFDQKEKATTSSYNSTYRRLFGLTSWFRKHAANPGDEVVVTLLKEPLYSFRIEFEQAEKSQDDISGEKEAKALIDLSGISSVSKGDIVEDRVKELIVLYSQGLLSVYKPVSDIEGIDLIIVKSGIFQPIFLQVKGRFNLQKNRSIIADINLKTFNPHHSYYVVIVYFNPFTLEINDNILFIPTVEVKEKAVLIKSNYGQRYRVGTFLNPHSKSKWAKYLVKKSELANKLLEKFSEMEIYLK